MYNGKRRTEVGWPIAAVYARAGAQKTTRSVEAGAGGTQRRTGVQNDRSGDGGVEQDSIIRE